MSAPTNPKPGGLLLALNKEPASTRSGLEGAAGERAVAAELDELAGDHLIALHVRAAPVRRKALTGEHRPPRRRRYGQQGGRREDASGTLELRCGGGLFGPRVEKLYIGGRDRTSLVEGLITQMGAVRAELDAVAADVPIRGALCFVGTDLPWFGSSSIACVPLVGRRGLAKLMKVPREFTAVDRGPLARFFDARFPPAR